MNNQPKLLRRIFLYSMFVSPAFVLTFENTEEQSNDISDIKRSFCKHFTNVSVADTLTANTLNVSNGANVSGGLAVTGSLFINGASIGFAPQYAFVGNLAQGGGGQIVADNNPIVFTYTNPAVSTSGIIIPASGQSIFTVEQPGTYLIQYSLTAGNAGAAGTVIVLQNVGGTIIPNSTIGSSGNGTAQISGTFITTLSANQRFQLVNKSGANVTSTNDANLTAAGGFSLYIAMVRIA